MGRPKRYGPKTLAEDAGMNSEREPRSKDPELMPDVKRTYRVTVGKPTTCTPEITRVMADLLTAGLSIPVAAQAVGIPKGTWLDWNSYGKRDVARGVDSPYARWWESMLEAKASCEANLVRMVCAGSVHDWKAAAWLLERRHPERWQSADKRPDRGNKDDLSGKSTEELYKLLGDLREGKAVPAQLPSETSDSEALLGGTDEDEGSDEDDSDEDEAPEMLTIDSTSTDVDDP